MAKIAEITEKDVVLEVGPGKGILTRELLKKAKKVIAIEKDEALYTFLKEKFGNLNNLTLIQADIRDVLKSPRKYNITFKNIKIVANIPYYLTGQLLRLFLDLGQSKALAKIVLMIQKEVAQRIISGQNQAMSKKKMNLLAISIQVFAKPHIAFYVSRKNFRPQPNVDSAVIILEKRSKNLFKEQKINQKDFFKLVKAGFAHKRKLLINNLKSVLRPVSSNTFSECKIDSKARAENLSLEDWVCLVKSLNQK